ncbi:MAG: cyclase [Oscillospiraceae bacterium]|nr:cyclase [Oscillospiraceae bacterium]MDE6841030.1 cyclase family protein [Oscillospiraceae bacterium]
MSVYQLGGLRVVDLTKPLDPAAESRRCHMYRFNTGGPIPDYHTIMDLTSHLGTHCECPYHHEDSWPDVAALPLTSFMGRCVYVELEGVAPNGYITPEVLDRALGGRIQAGDVVILDSPYKLPPFTPKTNTEEDQRLLVNGETGRWMVEHGVKSVGFGDGVSIENRNEDVKPFHDVCMAKNITFLEVLKNLDQLQSDTFFISFAPLPIRGLDSCPVRVYAIEGLPGF